MIVETSQAALWPMAIGGVQWARLIVRLPPPPPLLPLSMRWEKCFPWSSQDIRCIMLCVANVVLHTHHAVSDICDGPCCSRAHILRARHSLGGLTSRLVGLMATGNLRMRSAFCEIWCCDSTAPITTKQPTNSKKKKEKKWTQQHNNSIWRSRRGNYYRRRRTLLPRGQWGQERNNKSRYKYVLYIFENEAKRGIHTTFLSLPYSLTLYAAALNFITLRPGLCWFRHKERDNWIAGDLAFVRCQREACWFFGFSIFSLYILVLFFFFVLLLPTIAALCVCVCVRASASGQGLHTDDDDVTNVCRPVSVGHRSVNLFDIIIDSSGGAAVRHASQIEGWRQNPFGV